MTIAIEKWIINAKEWIQKERNASRQNAFSSELLGWKFAIVFFSLLWVWLRCSGRWNLPCVSQNFHCFNTISIFIAIIVIIIIITIHRQLIGWINSFWKCVHIMAIFDWSSDFHNSFCFRRQNCCMRNECFSFLSWQRYFTDFVIYTSFRTYAHSIFILYIVTIIHILVT